MTAKQLGRMMVRCNEAVNKARKEYEKQLSIRAKIRKALAVAQR